MSTGRLWRHIAQHYSRCIQLHLCLKICRLHTKSSETLSQHQPHTCQLGNRHKQSPRRLDLKPDRGHTDLLDSQRRSFRQQRHTVRIHMRRKRLRDLSRYQLDLQHKQCMSYSPKLHHPHRSQLRKRNKACPDCRRRPACQRHSQCIRLYPMQHIVRQSNRYIIQSASRQS